MISWDTEGNLVLTPRAFAEGQDAKHIKLPLERGYVCPNCSTMIYGVFPTRQDKTRLVSLNNYAVGNETVNVRPDYKSELVVLGSSKYQHFYDLNHFGEDKLLARVNEASAYRCKFVKFFYEPSIPRLFHRFAKDMSGMELYGIGAAGVYYRDHAELLEACQKDHRRQHGPHAGIPGDASLWTVCSGLRQQGAGRLCPDVPPRTSAVEEFL